MGEGWIRVEAKALRSDTALVDWLKAATRNLEQRNPNCLRTSIRRARSLGDVHPVE
jgi:hypothetical protein